MTIIIRRYEPCWFITTTRPAHRCSRVWGPRSRRLHASDENLTFLSKPGLNCRNQFDTNSLEAQRSIMGGLHTLAPQAAERKTLTFTVIEGDEAIDTLIARRDALLDA